MDYSHQTPTITKVTEVQIQLIIIGVSIVIVLVVEFIQQRLIEGRNRRLRDFSLQSSLRESP